MSFHSVASLLENMSKSRWWSEDWTSTFEVVGQKFIPSPKKAAKSFRMLFHWPETLILILVTDELDTGPDLMKVAGLDQSLFVSLTQWNHGASVLTNTWTFILFWLLLLTLYIRGLSVRNAKGFQRRRILSKRSIWSQTEIPTVLARLISANQRHLSRREAEEQRETETEEKPELSCCWRANAAGRWSIGDD